MALLLSAGGCSTTAHSPNAGAGVLSVPVEFQDSSGQPTAKGPSDSQLLLGAISGELNGAARTTFKTQGIGDSANIDVDLSELARLSAKKPAPLSSTAAAAGWTIAPANARLLRVATALLSEQNGWHSAITGFADSITKKTLVLVYFDRPCRLSGTVITHPTSGGIRADAVDVVIEKAGLNWLEITKIDGDGNYEIRRAPESVRPVLTARSRSG